MYGNLVVVKSSIEEFNYEKANLNISYCVNDGILIYSRIRYNERRVAIAITRGNCYNG